MDAKLEFAEQIQGTNQQQKRRIRSATNMYRRTGFHSIAMKNRKTELHHIALGYRVRAHSTPVKHLLLSTFCFIE